MDLTWLRLEGVLMVIGTVLLLGAAPGVGGFGSVIPTGGVTVAVLLIGVPAVVGVPVTVTVTKSPMAGAVVPAATLAGKLKVRAFRLIWVVLLGELQVAVPLAVQVQPVKVTWLGIGSLKVTPLAALPPRFQTTMV